MKCPQCKVRLRVIDSREYDGFRLRKYKCPDCEWQDITEERYQDLKGGEDIDEPDKTVRRKG